MASFPIRSLALGLTLTVASAQLGVAQTAPEAPPPRSGLAMPQSANPDPIVTEGVIEDEAVQAVKDMSSYLTSLNTIGITSQGSLDVVTNDGQRIQLDGTTTYKVRKPGFVIDYVSDQKTRRFIYDGKNFTVYSPLLGFYAQAPAPGSNREVLDTI
jgi:hypothetical protein